MILNVQPSLDRFDALDRQCHGQDQDAGKMVQRQCQEHRSVFFLFVGRQRRSDGCDMTSSVGQRSATELAGIDSGGLPGGCQDITQRAVGEEQCAGPAADARGREIQVKEQRTRNQSLIEEFVLSTNILQQRSAIFSRDWPL